MHAHFVTRRIPKCLLRSNGLLEHAVINLYYEMAIEQYVHPSYMAQGYSIP